MKFLKWFFNGVVEEISIVMAILISIWYIYLGGYFLYICFPVYLIVIVPSIWYTKRMEKYYNDLRISLNYYSVYGTFPTTQSFFSKSPKETYTKYLEKNFYILRSRHDIIAFFELNPNHSAVGILSELDPTGIVKTKFFKDNMVLIKKEKGILW